MRFTFVVAVGLASACASSKPIAAEPEPEPEPSAAFTFVPARHLPMTLQYLVDGGEPVACQLTDAGVPGVDGDFKVSCMPERLEWCLSETYFGTYPPADGMWIASGCYLAKGDDLWWFPACPTSAAGFDDPAKAGAIANFVGPETWPEGLPESIEPRLRRLGEERFGQTVDVDGMAISVDCDGGRVNGMMKEVTFETCVSPAYGPVSSRGEWKEGEDYEQVCEEAVRLVAVEPGLHTPER